MEKRQCQNCKQDFVIESDDFGFYEKMQVSPPTFCPECRLVRRMAWRNERSLYKKKNSALEATEPEILSMYAPDSPYTVYDKEYWWSGRWDPLAYGAEYDFSKPFFQQFDELMKRIPQQALQLMNSVNSQYCNYIDNNKNCYLVFGTGWSENCRYLNRSSFSKDSQDTLTSQHNEVSYELVDCQDSFRLIASELCIACVDSSFLYNCRNCTNCFGCSNLNNKSYCFLNEQLIREEYQEKLKNLNLQNADNFKEWQNKFEREIKAKAIRRFANIFQCHNCSGDNLTKSKNCHVSFDIYGEGENSKHLVHCFKDKENYDAYGNYGMELCYECVDNDVGMSNFATVTVYSSNNCSYCFTCRAASNLFGCVGLQGREYCILNKQYSKEDYFALKEKIIKHMKDMPYQDVQGRIYGYGEFFPMEISPWAYNETIAIEYFPITREQAIKRGYRWQEKEPRNYSIDIVNEDIPADLANADESILGKSIMCEHYAIKNHAWKCDAACTEGFKLIPDELNFYRRLGLPLPRLCPNCRHYGRLNKRNPMKLWSRQCMCDQKHSHHLGRCKVEFETSYAPDRPEIVYCERCYQAEVY